jgi:hypothetical protein
VRIANGKVERLADNFFAVTKGRAQAAARKSSMMSAESMVTA